MTKREKVIDFLCKVNSEGMDYFFSSYVSPEGARDMARRAGVSADLCEKLYKAAKMYDEIHNLLEDRLCEIRDEFGIEEEEVEI